MKQDVVSAPGSANIKLDEWMDKEIEEHFNVHNYRSSSVIVMHETGRQPDWKQEEMIDGGMNRYKK